MALIVSLLLLLGCKRKDPLYCDENQMCSMGYEACDLTAACTELRNTCLAPEDVCWDAAVLGHLIGGTAEGVRAPATLRLDWNGGNELLEIAADGAFAFEARLLPGTSYAVSLTGTPPCVLGNGSGTTSNVDVTDVLLTCEGVTELASVSFSAPIVLQPPFSPSQTVYSADASTLVQVTTVTPTTGSAEASVTVELAPVASGVESDPITLGPGVTSLDVVVSHPSGLERAYQINVDRGAGEAQYGYGKSDYTDLYDGIGHSVAVAGDTIVVGSIGESGSIPGVNGNPADNGAPSAGAAWVFRRSGTECTQEAYVKASNPDTLDVFGSSVAISGDVFVVGAPGEASSSSGINGNQADNSWFEAGAAYVFRRSGTTWVQEAYLKPSNPDEGDLFGASVAIDGDTIVVGSFLEDGNSPGINGVQNNSSNAVGAAYVFRYNGSNWYQEAYIKPSNARDGLQFGRSLSLSGNTLAVGSIQENSNATGINGNQADTSMVGAGAVYVFTRSGSVWSQQAYVKPSNTGAGDHFGWSVSASGDLLAVGAPDEDSNAAIVNGNQTDNSATSAGAVYVFRRSGTVWAQEAYLKASNAWGSDWFGRAVAVAGNVVAVGAYGEDSNATGIDANQADNSASLAGAAYLFGYSSSWAQQAYVKASNTNGADNFGWSVALSADTLVVGATGEDSSATGFGGNQTDNSADGSGAIYLFR